METKRTVVGIGEVLVTDSPGEILVTYSLGSCIGIAIHDPATGTVGLAHFKLPSSIQDRERAAKEPGLFVDTGMAELLKLMAGRSGSAKGFVVKVAGGGKFLGGDPSDLWFGISPEGIGSIGMLVNAVITVIVTLLTPPPPPEVAELVEKVRTPRRGLPLRTH